MAFIDFIRSNFSIEIKTRSFIRSNLVGLLLGLLILIDVEVSELIAVLGDGDDAQPIAELVLLQELLGQVLQVSMMKTKRQKLNINLLESGC